MTAPDSIQLSRYRGGLTARQYEFLTRGINPARIQHLRGQSHVEQWDIRRHLIRVFGYGGFNIDTKSLDLVREIEVKSGERSRWTVVYRAEVRLTIKAADGSQIAHYEDGASGDSQNQPSLGDAHDMAMKTALSQALKRCAVNLGDQFGLGLYNGGSADPVVVASLVVPAGDETAGADVPADDEPVRPEPKPVHDGEAVAEIEPVTNQDVRAATKAEPPAPESEAERAAKQEENRRKWRDRIEKAPSVEAVEAIRGEASKWLDRELYPPDAPGKAGMTIGEALDARLTTLTAPHCAADDVVEVPLLNGEDEPDPYAGDDDDSFPAEAAPPDPEVPRRPDPERLREDTDRRRAVLKLLEDQHGDVAALVMARYRQPVGDVSTSRLSELLERRSYGS